MLRSLSYVLSRRRARIASEGCGPSPGSTESSRQSLQTFPEGHTRITIFLTLLAIGVPGCAATRSMPTAEPPVLDSAGDRQSVIAVAERLFSAMKSRDTTAIRQLLAPELVLISIRTAGTTPTQTRRTTVSEFVTSIARSPEDLLERMLEYKGRSAGRSGVALGSV